MFMTKGIIVDAGASLIQDPLYDDKVKVRIPELHGYGELVKGFQEKDYTEDQYLPWCKIIATSVNILTKYPILQYKAQTYAPADIVYVQIDNDSPNTNYTVIGLFAKYNEDTSDPTLTIYNNIDVSSILQNKIDFPKELIDPSLNETGGSTSGGSSDSGGGGSSGESSEGAPNTTEYKYIFGNPFSSKNYRITSQFPKRHITYGDPHNGIDLAVAQGTPIYAVGDGVVMNFQFCNTITRKGYAGCADGNYCGNHLFIDHGTHKGTHYYTMYAHMVSVSVKPGTNVKGTQYVPDTSWEKAYKKEGSTYTRLTTKPNDWDYGGWSKYYKNTGTSRNPVYETVKDVLQKGTEIGKVGTTGSSTGPHLHFTITTKNTEWATRQIKNGYIKNPENYIAF